MIRLWVVAVIIATNGLHLAYETVDTISLNEGSIWSQSSNPLSLLHHSTSNLDSNDAKLYINFNTQRISKDSFWRRFGNKKYNFENKSTQNVFDYFRSLYLTFVILFSLLAYNRYIKQKYEFEDRSDELNHKLKPKHNKVHEVVSDIEISLFCLLPLRTMSRIWGKLNSIELPLSLRKLVLNAYIQTFGCNLDEALEQDLTQYKNLNQFFRRSLKPGVRPIDPTNGVVSPADGTVLHFGKASNGRVEQVKGITYSLSKFLGPQTWNERQTEKILNSYEYQKNLLIDPKNNGIKTDLYSCVIYLSPGDYHRFHSPANWSVDFRRHFAGQLLSVRPGFVSGFPNLFAINERVVYTGQWDYGFFSMTAVGATNVGTVRTYFDKDLITNEKNWTEGEYHDYELKRKVEMNKGQAFGEFNLGSTIVLIFEAPENVEFTVKSGQRIKYGEVLAKI